MEIFQISVETNDSDIKVPIKDICMCVLDLSGKSEIFTQIKKSRFESNREHNIGIRIES